MLPESQPQQWATNGTETCEECNHQHKVYIELATEGFNPPPAGLRVKFVCPECGHKNQVTPTHWGGPSLEPFPELYPDAEYVKGEVV